MPLGEIAITKTSEIISSGGLDELNCYCLRMLPLLTLNSALHQSIAGTYLSH